MHILPRRVLSAIAAGTLIAMTGATSTATASAQESVVVTVQGAAPVLLSAESEDDSQSGSTVKWVLISAVAGLGLGGVIAGIQAFLRRRDDPRPKDRYGR